MGVQPSWATVAIVIGNLLILLGLGVAYFDLSYNPYRPRPQDPPKENERVERSLWTNDTEVSGTSSCDGAEWECNSRLASGVIPVHYDIHLRPDINQGVFEGRVRILLNITLPVDHIRIHLKDLNITATSVRRINRDPAAGPAEIAIRETLVYGPNEYFVIRPVHPLSPGEYQVRLKFGGSLVRGIVGFYRSQYFDPLRNRTQYVVSTKFQPTYARRAFPCLDEPGFKSSFSVTLVKPSSLVALSNMPIAKQEVGIPTVNETTVHFEKSVPMVTYLVAVAVGDFDYTSTKSRKGLPIRAFATKFQVEKTRFALSIAPKLVEFYEDYFGIDYPLPKLDVIGIPNFVSGAMEHWGLVSFRESFLLYHRNYSTVANKQRVAQVVAHEIVHMWFGNLMTLKWWSDLWLNEGFASYFEYKGVQSVHPEWDIESQFVSEDLTPVLDLDSKLSSHPILQEVSDPDQITELFDTISYRKGSSIIRMLEHFIGPEPFRRGVSHFLKKFAYKNAETQDLWDSLQAEVGPNTNISFMMDTWTRQMGFPILYTETVDHKVKILQQRYLIPSGRNVDNETYRWEIPVKVGSFSNTSYVTVLMHQTEEKLEVPVSHWKNWTKVNPQSFGYFRVQYTPKAWKEIQKEFLTSFEPTERCGLIDDIFSFAYSDHVTYDLALDFSRALILESHLVPWDCAKNHLEKISSLLQFASNETYAGFKNYIVHLTDTVYPRFSWTQTTDETHLDGLLKLRIFSLACSHGLADCLANASNRFNDWIETGANIQPALRPVVYKWGMWQANGQVWEIVWNRYLNEGDAQERTRLLSSLASSQNSTILRRLINLAGNESLVRRQDFFTLMAFLAHNPVGNPIVWTYYREEYTSLVARFTTNDRHFGRMILDITSSYSSQSDLDEINAFLKLNPEGGAGKRARATTLETVQANFQWQRRIIPVIKKWLVNNRFG